jgi:hypothetical protein
MQPHYSSTLSSLLLLYPAVYYPVIVMLTAYGFVVLREQLRAPATSTEEPEWEEIPAEVAEP